MKHNANKNLNTSIQNLDRAMLEIKMLLNHEQGNVDPDRLAKIYECYTDLESTYDKLKELEEEV